MQTLRRLLPLASLSLGLACLLDAWVTVEWWYPYCDAPTDGPAAALFGMPLPATRFSQVSSLTYDVAPLWLALDVALLALLLALPLAAVAARVAESRAPQARRAASLVGIALVMGRLAWLAVGVSLGTIRPVASLAPPYAGGGATDLRPSRLVTSWHSECGR